jgi:uncharacterized protein (TIGR04255 family)
MTQLPPPLGGEPPPEIDLSRSPLKRVVAQARFSSVLKIDNREAVAAFQEEVRSDYPFFEQSMIQQLQIDPSAGISGFKSLPANVWRFRSADLGDVLSLSTDAVTLEAKSYEGRSQFLARWRKVLSLVQEVFSPQLSLRLGMRYVNRIDGESLSGLTEWIEDNLVGVAHPRLRDHVSQALSEANIAVEEGVLLLRWGILGANVTIDPNLLDPLPCKSWILDIDVATNAPPRPFIDSDLRAAFTALTGRAYAIFRYAITDRGLEHFGALA